MSVSKWMKWLSVIALVFAGLDLAGNIYDLITGEILVVNTITITLLAIVAVIISFKKK